MSQSSLQIIFNYIFPKKYKKIKIIFKKDRLGFRHCTYLVFLGCKFLDFLLLLTINFRRLPNFFIFLSMQDEFAFEINANGTFTNEQKVEDELEFVSLPNVELPLNS